jgi:putative NADH-flavin reductase
MRVAIFGGAGRVGSLLVSGAVASGYSATTLVREPLADRPGVTSIVGDVLDESHVARVVQGADAVLSALGAPSLEQPGKVLSGGMKTIARVMARHNLSRIVALAGSGILDDSRGGLRHDQPEFPAMFKAISLEHAGTWQALKASGLDWTVVCATTLVSGSAPTRVRTGADQLPAGGVEIGLADVARFMLDELTRRAFLKHRVGITW